jgi:hypothetical protein
MKHFTVLDRDLFCAIKFQDLVEPNSIHPEVVTENVLDWSIYTKARVYWKKDGDRSYRTSALAAVRARFNMLVNFVQTEIVLCPWHNRNAVAAKFIRMALVSPSRCQNYRVY